MMAVYEKGKVSQTFAEQHCATEQQEASIEECAMIDCGTNPGKSPVTPNFTKVEMSSGTETLVAADGDCLFASPQPRC